MKASIIRALIAVVAGVLMIQYREKMVEWLTISIGILFFISGVISIINYYVGCQKQAKAGAKAAEAQAQAGADAAQGAEGEGQAQAPIRKPTFPIVGIGCALLGIILAMMPDTVSDYLVYVFALILILGAVGEYFALLSARSMVREFEKAASVKATTRLSYHFWVLPTLLFLFGLFALVYPDQIKSAPLLFLGIAMIVYGISEVINAIKFYSVRRYIRRQQIVDVVRSDNDITDAVIVEETSAEETSSVETAEETSAEETKEDTADTSETALTPQQ